MLLSYIKLFVTFFFNIFPKRKRLLKYIADIKHIDKKKRKILI